ncbi:PspC domain-containing protein [Cellvibrio polysaccharolyticus]|uniref:PspC domain-containing protein n=1 Tax=Cellvibrio polysaccharolyticus TaxID=2082724 RepID=UPI0018810323|nr:PspC domain-containing protein [Cellvibrio polysaccharolyticus]
MDIRKSKDRVLAGVAGGIAEYQQMSVRFVRFIWFVSFILSGGSALGVYVLMAFLMKPPSDFDINNYRQQ